MVIDPETGERLGVVSQWGFEWFFSGPLPSPETLAGYDEVLPGLARRIVERWEREAEHRQSLERSIVKSQLVLQNRGQVIAALISLVVLAAGIVFVATGKGTAGLVALLAPLAVLAAAFIYREVRSRQIED